MEVGPSAAPMIPIDAASLSSNPISDATQIAKKMPNCAAAPKIISFGFVRSGPKSIIAPTPIKSSNGNNSFSIPALYKTLKAPSCNASPTVWSTAPESGKLTKITPKPIGKSNVGSISFFMARKISTPPIAHIMSIR